MTTTSVRPDTSVDARGRERTNRILVGLLRFGVASLWIANVGWKRPPDFESLRKYTTDAITYPVFRPYGSLVEHLVLPHFTFFAWMTVLVEASLGAFLMIGLGTRFWALIGIAQCIVITLSARNAPNEWEWSYYLMILANVAVFATYAGRSFGLDGVMRPIWRRSRGWLPRTMLKIS